MTWRDPTAGAADSRVRRAFDSLSQRLQDLLVPPGTLHAYMFSTLPSDKYTFCDGGSVADAEVLYPRLWELADSSWKSGSSLTKPDLRGRIPVGLDNMGGSDAGRLSVTNTLGGTGGAETHTLTQAELPNVKLTPDAVATFATNGGATGVAYGDIGFGNFKIQSTTYTQALGSGQAHSNMQPYVLLNWILKLA